MPVDHLWSDAIIPILIAALLVIEGLLIARRRRRMRAHGSPAMNPRAVLPVIIIAAAGIALGLYIPDSGP